jgi:hypothetical protein
MWIMNNSLQLSLFALLSLAAASLLAQPKLKIAEGSKFDLGAIDRGSVVEKKLALKNVGTDTLILGAVEVSCGCTGTVVSDNRIAPGRSGSLLITFNSKNFVGPIHKSLTVNSNSAGEPRTLIEFTGNVVEEVSVTPAHLLFRDAEVGKLATTIVTVKNQSRQDLVLTGFKTSLPGLLLKLPPEPIPPGQSTQIAFEFAPKSVVSVLSDGVTLTTSSKKQPEILIQIFGNTKEFKFQ